MVKATSDVRFSLMLLLQCILLSILTPCPQAKADLIDFEHGAMGGNPCDDCDQANPYFITAGVPADGTVRFFFDLNGNNTYETTDDFARFERTGEGSNQTHAFVSHWMNPNEHDTPRPGYEEQLGNFMLRKPVRQGNGPVPAPFLALYDTPLTITQLSGEIWDIDAREKWRVDVLNSNGDVLAFQDSPFFSGSTGLDSLDSLPWQFQFTNLPAGVRSVRLTFTGVNDNGVGLAFNNFNPTFAEILPGDYNRNGFVEASDYVLWRKTLHSTTNLAADGDISGEIDEGDYGVWSENYARPTAGGSADAFATEFSQAGAALLSNSGATLNTGSHAANLSVPEASAFAMALLGGAIGLAARRR